VIQEATLPTMQVSVSSANNPPLQDSVQNISLLAKHEGKLVPVYTMNGSGWLHILGALPPGKKPPVLIE